jgi:uncharacterized protein
VKFPLRYLLFAIIVLLVIWFWRRPRSSASPPKPDVPDERMVQCQRCGVYLPQSDAFHCDDSFYCSVEHRDVDRGGKR